MKSTMSQAFMITLAIVFAIALSLTIALICVSYTGKDTDDILPRDTETESDTTFVTETLPVYKPLDSLPTAETTTPQVTTAEPTPEKEPLPVGNGLAFASNGNGTCTLVGIGTCTDVCIVIPEHSPSGDRVTSIAPRALYGISAVTAIQIPSTVTSIGELAFAACHNLVYISVSKNNSYYCDIDGILYTADGFTLLLYPPMRAGNTATISASTSEILEMAFYNCAYLTHIHYTGSAEQWEKIAIGTKNYSLTAAAKTFGNNGKK